MEAYNRAYEKKRDLSTLERMYHLTLLNPKLELKERYKSVISPELMEKWNGDFEWAKEEAKDSKEVKEIGRLFERDSVRRMEGAALLVEEWKQEYRGMA